MKCPGQDSRYWGPEAIFDVPCPACNAMVEFFKDEATRRCTSCGFRFRNPHIDVGCAEWCKYAKQCFGDVPLKEDDASTGKVSVLDALVTAVRDVVGENEPTVRRGMRVVAQAQELLMEEKAVPKIVMAAALLGSLEEQEQVRRVMERAEFDPTAVPDVLAILGGAPGEERASEAAVVADADQLVQLAQELEQQPAPAGAALDERFQTRVGRRHAESLISKA